MTRREPRDTDNANVDKWARRAAAPYPVSNPEFKMTIHPMWKRLALVCTLGLLGGALAISMHPVHSGLQKLALLACLAGTWVGGVMLAWPRLHLRIFLLILPALLVIPFYLPAREIDATELRQDYVRRMTGFEGTPYFWGGESADGIDCSGLPRRAFRDALLAYGFRHFNGLAFRVYAEQWWYDASAKALAQGHRDYTKPIGISGTIQAMDYDGLLPGDLAVTSDGVHVLAYAGQGRWIQADPGIGAVATLDGRTNPNGWFASPVTTHRWSLLAR